MKAIEKYRFVLTVAALCGGWAFAAAALPELPDRDGFNIKGYVHDGDKGVAGVLVSDGYSFARTDDSGAYYIASDPAAKEVFVVLPAGYEYAGVTNGVPEFFKPLDGSGSMQADFALNPIGDDSSFTFLVHADTQPEEYFNSHVYTDMGNAYKDMQQSSDALAAADGFKPLNLHLGDIIYNGSAINYDYSRFLSTLGSVGYNVPVLPTPGNHDRYYTTDYNKAMELYRGTWGPVYYSFNRGKVHFISVDNVLVKKNDAYTKGISDAAVEWLKKDLSYVEDGSRVVFYTHQPMTRNTSALKAYSGVLDILKNYEVLILTGHLHRIFNNFPEYAPSIKERNHVALGGYEWRSTCSQDGVPNGYYIYSVSGSDISWKFKPTGKDADKNMFRVYEPGFPDTDQVRPSDDKTVLVNVWDWDEDWTVTWSLDGEDQGDVPRYDTMKDPLASYNYDNVPGHDTWLAHETYHIFHCDVPSTGSVVKVTVSDPFGRTLSKTLELASVPGGIEAVAPESSGVQRADIYNLQGVRLLSVDGYPETDTLPLGAGCYIMRLRHTDGAVTVEKFMR
ncbi:MAG: calcineurin-like phosphoesterase family protein [Muribaculaceae bacterium]|nr:calcineurin-like phosphoesterase family protein [Muribaculaceae bacterium]